MIRLARLAVDRPRRVLLVACPILLVAAIIGLPIIGMLKSNLSDFQDPSSQNQRALRIVEVATKQSPFFGTVALVPSHGDVYSRPSAADDARRIAALLTAQPGAQRVVDYPTTHLPQLVSRDGRETAVLAAFASQGQSAAAVAKLRSILGRSSRVRFGGSDIAFSEMNSRISSDLQRTELIVFPILMLLSLWIFRGVVAATLPLLVGGFAIALTFCLLRAINEVVGLSIFAVDLVSGLGLGLGIDYSLFVLWRYREEVAGDANPREAIVRTLQTAGRTVLYSSLTVAGSLASLLVFPLRFLYSMGIGGIVVALAAGGVSLVVLPAVLVILGPRVDALPLGRLPAGSARAVEGGRRGGWYALASGVMRHPGAIAAGSAAVLIACALPALHLKLTPVNASMLPSSFQSRQVADDLSTNFIGDGSQEIVVAARASATSTRRIQALATRARSLVKDRAIELPPRYLGHGSWEIAFFPRGSSASSTNQRVTESLRALVNPDGALVGGLTAWFIDQKSTIASRIPLALLVLAFVTMTSLFLMTGSVVIPLKALVMNLLTVTVGFGILVLIFQDGHLAALFGVRPIGGLEEANLLLLFVLAFALATDYGVFLFGRIKEAHDAGLGNREAVALGIERTGRLITAAALLFCVAVGAFMTSQIFFIKQYAFGTALSVAIDATLVRILLVPSLMALLGDWNWWSPRLLRRLHARIGHEIPRELPRDCGLSAAGVLSVGEAERE